MIIDGTALAQGIKESLRERAAALSGRAGRRPCLAVVLVGDNPASRTYVRSKIKAAAFVGIEGREVEFPATVSEEELLKAVAALDADPLVDGILVQLPLPHQINPDRVLDVISPEKDVDGFHPQNVAALQLGRPCTVPCTPKGIIRLIESTGTDIDGKFAVVVGRSNIVGKPLAKLLLDRNATVAIAHSHTPCLAELTRRADILVVATGHAGLIDGYMVKPGAIVIDVGITRMPDKSIRGDVDFDSASRYAGFITPMPGGVGPMTVAMLMENTLECFEKRVVNASL
ncbi:MAG: bifunctional 5,10-methylenetetrahydrofolate dehydrogenase/5,10-methenyltetrahydrofolate cyclohydrolase [Bacteroidales bacterium]|nr:bifunctional 5,10-methylenetetrahydrofolate dehydrogenase/5,10-methenyltetrahydrofolate cyclohydrolase [Bacteroidales bacterium]